MLEVRIYSKVHIDKRDTYGVFGVNCVGRYSGDMEVNNCQMPYSVASFEGLFIDNRIYRTKR